MDAKYVLLGSDDGNVRLWQANPSGRAVVWRAHEQQKLDYQEHLKEQFKHMPKI